MNLKNGSQLFKFCCTRQCLVAGNGAGTAQMPAECILFVLFLSLIVALL